MNPTTFQPIKRLTGLVSNVTSFFGQGFTFVKDKSKYFCSFLSKTIWMLINRIDSLFRPQKKIQTHKNLYIVNTHSVAATHSLTSRLQESLEKQFALEEKNQVDNIQKVLKSCKKTYIKYICILVNKYKNLKKENQLDLNDVIFGYLTQKMKGEKIPQVSISFLELYIKKVTKQTTSRSTESMSIHAASVQLLTHLHRLELSFVYLFHIATQHNLSSHEMELLFHQALTGSPFEVESLLLTLQEMPSSS